MHRENVGGLESHRIQHLIEHRHCWFLTKIREQRLELYRYQTCSQVCCWWYQAAFLISAQFKIIVIDCKRKLLVKVGHARVVVNGYIQISGSICHIHYAAQWAVCAKANHDWFLHTEQWFLAGRLCHEKTSLTIDKAQSKRNTVLNVCTICVRMSDLVETLLIGLNKCAALTLVALGPIFVHQVGRRCWLAVPGWHQLTPI